MSVSYLFPPSGDGGVQPPARPETGAPKRNTKAVGDLSEATVIAALIRQGYLVSIPFGENHRYDIIADDGERRLRIQVKTGRVIDGAFVKFACSSMHYHRRTGTSACRPYFGEIDYLAVHVPTSGKVYLVPESELVATQGRLRMVPPRDRQARNIRWAADYELV